MQSSSPVAKKTSHLKSLSSFFLLTSWINIPRMESGWSESDQVDEQTGCSILMDCTGKGKWTKSTSCSQGFLITTMYVMDLGYPLTGY
ncbi:hypothetical protein V6N13_011078 [Hibiscus sabdariffa]